MTYINTKKPFTPPSTEASKSHSSPSRETPPKQNNDHYNSATPNASNQLTDPYSSVDWSKVDYHGFPGVDWKSINYNVGEQSQGSHKSAPEGSTGSAGVGGDSAATWHMSKAAGHFNRPGKENSPAAQPPRSNTAGTVAPTSSSAPVAVAPANPPPASPAATPTASASVPTPSPTANAGTIASPAAPSAPAAPVATNDSGSMAASTPAVKPPVVAAAANPSTSTASGPGIWLTNASNSAQTYGFYDNASNGVGTANPTYTNPTASVTLAPGETKFVPLSADFKGRVQKTDGDPNENTWATASTWAEFQLSASNDHAAHGDISYQTGFDGAATIASTDGSNQVGGTTQDLIPGAPANILAKSATGAEAIANNTNAAATAYLQAHVDETKAYTGNAGTGTNDISSKNNQLAVTFY